jgi:hypothetical protein
LVDGHVEGISKMGSRMKAVLGLTAAGVAASMLIPAAAQASATVTFCNGSGAYEYFDVPPVGNLQGYRSVNLSPGRCVSASFNGPSRLAVAYRQVNGQWQAVATHTVSGSESFTWVV